MSETTTYTSQLYRTFKEIDADSYRTILRFVEDHSSDIPHLELREYFDLKYAYVAALYETEGFAEVVTLSDELLALVISEDLRWVGHEDAYRALLFRRAGSLYHLMRYEECVFVCDQLLRLYPHFNQAAMLLEKALYQRPNAWVSRGRALSIVLFLAAACIIAVEVLVVRNFFAVHADAIEVVRNACFLVGWSLLLGGDIGHRTWAWAAVRRRSSRYAQRRAARHPLND